MTGTRDEIPLDLLSGCDGDLPSIGGLLDGSNDGNQNGMEHEREISLDLLYTNGEKDRGLYAFANARSRHVV